MARPENKQETEALSVTVPASAYQYLTYLARNSMLGANENDIAARLLTDRLSELAIAKFHDVSIPKG
jgi:hypothetical protein